MTGENCSEDGHIPDPIYNHYDISRRDRRPPNYRQTKLLFDYKCKLALKNLAFIRVEQYWSIEMNRGLTGFFWRRKTGLFDPDYKIGKSNITYNYKNRKTKNTNFEELRHLYLCQVILAYKQDSQFPGIPKYIRKKIQNEVNSIGKIEWAKKTT